jgi:hypothetical protein
LPTVISGKNHCLEFPTKVTPIGIPFKSELGDVTVVVGLREACSGMPDAGEGN